MKKNNISFLYNHLISYPTPSNLNYFWNFGSLSGLCLLIQIITGIFLAMHYTAQIDNAFSSIEHITRDVTSGWFIRYLHSNGASMFFLVVYLHIARGLYYKSFKYESKTIWFSGLTILLLMMATAFIGYVLPWGQMSYWGSIVITSMFSALPYVGTNLVNWLWGGFSVGAATLSRFYSLHYLLPFLITFVVLIHLAELHNIGSSNPFPYEHHQFLTNKIFFYPYFAIKDFLGLLLFLIFYFIFIFFVPNYLGHSDNYIEANPLITPTHIVPEWYYLTYYAILRSIPNKLGGISLMLASILIFFTLPYINMLMTTAILNVMKNFNTTYLYKQPKYFYFKTIVEKLLLSMIFFLFISLAWIGSMPVEEPYTTVGFIYTISFFISVYMYAFISSL